MRTNDSVVVSPIVALCQERHRFSVAGLRRLHSIAPTRFSDPEDLLLFCLELLVAEDALISQLGESFELTPRTRVRVLQPGKEQAPQLRPAPRGY